MTGPKADLTTTAGEVLTVFVEDETVFLRSAAELTFKGELHLEPMGLV